MENVPEQAIIYEDKGQLMDVLRLIFFIKIKLIIYSYFY